jgi:diadenylate cyclase
MKQELLLFKIGFLPVSFWDILDILIVGYLMYQIYRLLRGSIAFNIFIGVLTLFVVYWLVKQLKMELLSAVLGQFVSLGVLILIIIFQPEVRRFLLFLGSTTLRQRSNFWGRFLDRNFDDNLRQRRSALSLKNAMLRMSRSKTGALIVMASDVNLDGLVNNGVQLDAQISEPLIESIFNKSSPLHDGAVIIENNLLKMASCILPVSENPDLPKSAGLRHRAAVGITEKAAVASFVVSEENGVISYAYNGQLERKLNEERLEALLTKHLN